MPTVDGEEAFLELELVCEGAGVRERDQRHFSCGIAPSFGGYAGTAVLQTAPTRREVLHSSAVL